MKRVVMLLCCVLFSTLSCAEETFVRPDTATIEKWGKADYILLGEVHDNAGGHELRLAWIKELVNKHTYALAFEQLDRDQQQVLHDKEQALLQVKAPYSDQQLRALAESGGFAFKGWHWSYYAPLFNLALTRQLPLIGTNLNEHQMMKIMMGGEGMVGLPPDWTKEMSEEMQSRVEKGHCDMLPKDMVAPMAQAQIRRDQALAESLVEAHHSTKGPVILLAGNGHLRNDLAVPFWLREFDPHATIVSIAVMEQGNDDNEPLSAFDAVYLVKAQDRKDPCEELKKHHFTMPHAKQ